MRSALRSLTLVAILALLGAMLLAACRQQAPQTTGNGSAPTAQDGDSGVGADQTPEPAADPDPEPNESETPEVEPDPDPEPKESETPNAEPDPAADPGADDDATPVAVGSGGSGEALTVYSGRDEELIGPILERFEEESNVDIEVRYGDSAELAATIAEEGANSPADVFIAQDAGSLGAVAGQDLLATLPESILDRVDERFRSPDGAWIGLSGRARVVAYNTEALQEGDLPDTIFGFTDPKWRGRIGWAPTNGSFQAFVTALRLIEGEDRAREWLEGIQANDPRVYESNSAIVEAVANGEIQVGFVNHYYLYRFLEEQGEGFGARNAYLSNGDPGALVNVAGAGILESSDQPQQAQQLLQFLLSQEAQQYFADETFEYPLVEGVKTNAALVPLDRIQTPDIDLGRLEDLQGTLELLQETGVL